MSSQDLDFKTEPRADRREIFLDAAHRVDALSGHLGDTTTGELNERYGDLLRGMADETVEFGAYPDVYPIPILELPNADRTSTAWNAARQDGFTFWWVRIPLLLFPRRDWAFSRLEVRVIFNPDEPEPRYRPKAFDILPNRRFDTIMRAGAELTVRVGGDGHFSVDTGEVSLASAGLPANAGVGVAAEAQAAAEIKIGIVPVRYRMVAARVNHTDEGLDRVFWRLDGSEFFRENSPQLIVVLQVPKAATTVEMLGVMQAYRRFTLFPARLQALIRELPEGLRAFFHQGAPITASTRYDLGPATVQTDTGDT